MTEPAFLYLPIVGVMGSGRDRHERAAGELGALIAEFGWNLLTGGGDGAMRTVTEAYGRHDHGLARSIAVLPEGRDHVAGADAPIRTGLVASEFEHGRLVGHSRNHLNVRLSDLIVALPGGRGTQSELALALLHRKPCIAFLREPDDRIGSLRVDGGVLQPSGVPVAMRIDAVRRFLRECAPPPIEPVDEAR